jgi:hypothetical protein
MRPARAATLSPKRKRRARQGRCVAISLTIWIVSLCYPLLRFGCVSESLLCLPHAFSLSKSSWLARLRLSSSCRHLKHIVQGKMVCILSPCDWLSAVRCSYARVHKTPYALCCAPNPLPIAQPAPAGMAGGRERVQRPPNSLVIMK